MLSSLERGALDGNERKRRIGENEAIFRSVNEEVSKLNITFTAATDTMGSSASAVSSCTVQIEITPEAYRRLREDATWFVIRPGHDLPGGRDRRREDRRLLDRAER